MFSHKNTLVDCFYSSSSINRSR